MIILFFPSPILTYYKLLFFILSPFFFIPACYSFKPVFSHLKLRLDNINPFFKPYHKNSLNDYILYINKFFFCLFDKIIK